MTTKGAVRPVDNPVLIGANRPECARMWPEQQSGPGDVREHVVSPGPDPFREGLSMDSTARPTPASYYSAGQWYTPQRYVIGWRDHDVIKVGYTSIGRRRYGRFLTRGGELLDLHTSTDALDAERHLQQALARYWPAAFGDSTEAVPLLGPRGSGWLECYRIPAADWPRVIAYAGGV